MKSFTKHIVLYVCLFLGVNASASHILGAEIFYKHVQNNQYLVTVNIYRDCNGCKINGNGGGTSSENCSEIDYIYVKGKDNSGSNEAKFALERQKIADISPVCKSKYSVCHSKSNSIFGIELQQFTSLVDLDNSAIKGYCNYQLYVSISERNSNITTGQATQNFCVDAYIQTCISKNNSPIFTSNPSFIFNSSKVQFQSFFVKDIDNDSLVYSLTPALTKIDKEASYNANYSYENPLTTYCIGTSPCAPDKVKNTGFYLDKHTGFIQFIPVQESEIAVMVIKIEEYRKISGKWELIGYIKRDIQVYIKSSDGNNSPKFLTEDYYEVCEEDNLIIKIEASDDKNTYTSEIDTVAFKLNSSIEGAEFSQVSQSTAPYNYALFSWTPKKGSSQNGLYTFNVSAKDNFCPFTSSSSQIITIKVKPKEDLKIQTKPLGCGNYEFISSAINSKSNLEIVVETASKKQVFKSNKTIDTASFLPLGKYFVKGTLTSENACKTFFIDSFINTVNHSNAVIQGNADVCKWSNYDYYIINLPTSNPQITWFYNSTSTTSTTSKNLINVNFTSNTVLSAYLFSQNGKWICKDTLAKTIDIIKLPEIESADEIKYCHGVGDVFINDINIKPAGGIWRSKHSAFMNDYILTNQSNPFENDTLILNYEIQYNGCKDAKNINFIIESLPEFKLSSSSICEIKSPIVMNNLVQKPYKIENYKVEFNFPLSSGMVKLENGFQVFYPNELGFGSHVYKGIITGKNGCKSYDTAKIEITPFVHITFDHEINICQGSGLMDINQISGVKPNNGTWSFYGFDLIVDRKLAKTDTCGTFELTYVYDNYGCFDTKKVQIKIDCKPKIDFIDFPEKVCDLLLPINLQSNMEGGIWNGNYVNGNTFSPPKVDMPLSHVITYSYKEGNCNFKYSKKMVVNPSPTINLTLDKVNFCDNELITLSGTLLNTNNITYKYLGKSKSETIVNTRSYNSENLFRCEYKKSKTSQDIQWIAQNDYGCLNTNGLFFNVHDQPHISPLSDTSVCENSGLMITPTINYDGSEALDYAWYDNSLKLGNDLNIGIDKLQVGNHKLVFQARHNFCQDEQSMSLEIKPKPFVDFVVQPSNVSTILHPTFWFLNQSNLNQTWLWNFGTSQSDNYSTETNAIYSYKDTGTYEVSLTGTNNFNCSDIRKRTLIVKPDLLLFIPNAFSPNHKDEEKNNVFGVSLQNYTSYSLEIFDRWGHKLFRSENPEETWDGTADGNVCTPDIYMYSVIITSITNQKYTYRGTITLIK